LMETYTTSCICGRWAIPSFCIIIVSMSITTFLACYHNSDIRPEQMN
jgi:hypothetical protein